MIASMEEAPSALLFMVLMVAICVLIAAFLPALLRRFSLSTSVLAIGFLGPMIGVVGVLLGAGAMTLSGLEVRSTLFVSGVTAVAMLGVGQRVARSIVKDLGAIVDSIEKVGAGERAVTGIERKGEIGRLVTSVDGLSQSLAAAEVERSVAEEERLAVVTALSHDLRTPLAAMLVSVEALQDGVGDSPTNLRAIRQNVLSLERLVDDLFLLARADSGSLGLNFESLDVAEIVDEAVDAVTPLAAGKSLTVKAEVPGPLMVRGDHVALGRVWRNLLDNAIRHAPEGSEICVSGRLTEDEASEQRYVLVEVRDEGSGFPEPFIDFALERFTQADDSRTGGAGLGLSISNALIQAHGGQVELHPGPGGRVWIWLPYEQSRHTRATVGPLLLSS